MTISLIVAAAENNVIGKENKLPWSLPEDMKFFKNTTWGMPVIMGRKSYEALGKPLPGRMNIVLTTQKDWTAENVQVANNIEDAINLAKAANCKEIFIIGGGNIFEQSMSIAHKIYLTRVHARLDGDAFFPAIDDTKWQLIHNIDFKKNEKHLYDFSFQQWVKK
ncbi:MAG: dihydrofolate reductase [Bacteroidetes bacterium]|nr:dihydrofolate reductase [Bacteroidota bacterium]MBS1756892.1 dihydrofolate reductase [Bacteroidota bacterium]